MSNVYQDAWLLTRDVREYVEPIQRRDAELARRLKRASDAVGSELDESLVARGRQRKRRFKDALGHAREASACLRAADAAGYADVDATLLEQLRSLEGKLRAA